MRSVPGSSARASWGRSPMASMTSRKLRLATTTSISTWPGPGSARPTDAMRTLSSIPGVPISARNRSPGEEARIVGTSSACASRLRRRTYRWSSRKAISSSGTVVSSSAASAERSLFEKPAGRSIRRQRSSGSSWPITRPSPQTADWASPSDMSVSVACSAPAVTRTRLRAPEPSAPSLVASSRTSPHRRTCDSTSSSAESPSVAGASSAPR